MTSEAWPRSEREFEEFFLAHFEPVYRLLFRVTGSRPEAEDLAQETFLRCHRRKPEAEGAGSPRPWLYRVAMNLAYNERRDRRRREERHRRAVAEPAAAGVDPADEAAREDERRRVRRALATLPPRQSQMLLLRHAGLSYAEVAAALQIRATSVGTLLSRAEEAFARAYGGFASARQKGIDGHV